MEYLQSFLIVVMEMVCFFLFQDAFVPTEKKHKSRFTHCGFWHCLFLHLLCRISLRTALL